MMNTENQEVVTADKNTKKRKHRRVEIKLIEDRAELNTTFTKRRQGLFKKAIKFCDEFKAQAAVIAFSRSGNAYVKSDPSFEPVLERYLADPASAVAAAGVPGMALVVPEKPVLTCMESTIRSALRKGRPEWDMITEDLGFSQLEEIEKALEFMKIKINNAAGACMD